MTMKKTSVLPGVGTAWFWCWAQSCRWWSTSPALSWRGWHTGAVRWEWSARCTTVPRCTRRMATTPPWWWSAPWWWGWGAPSSRCCCYSGASAGLPSHTPSLCPRGTGRNALICYFSIFCVANIHRFKWFSVMYVLIFAKVRFIYACSHSLCHAVLGGREEIMCWARFAYHLLRSADFIMIISISKLDVILLKKLQIISLEWTYKKCNTT